MASREQYHSKKTASSFSYSRSFILLLFFGSLFLGFSLFKSSLLPFRAPANEVTATFPTGDGASGSLNACDYSDGEWIYYPRGKSLRYDHTCKEIFKGWNCISSSKYNALDIVNWRWKPHRCELPQFDPLLFLQRFTNTSIGIRASLYLSVAHIQINSTLVHLTCKICFKFSFLLLINIYFFAPC